MSKDPQVRLAALESVSGSDDPGALNAVVKCATKDKDFQVRLAAVQALSTFDDTRALNALVECATKDKDWRYDIRLAAVQSMSTFDGPSALDALAQCLDDRERRVRWASGFALADRGDARAVPALIDFASDRRGYPPAVERSVIDLLKQFAISGNGEAVSFVIKRVDPDEVWKGGDGKAESDDVQLVEQFAAGGRLDAVLCLKKRQALPRYEQARSKIASGTASACTLREIHWSKNARDCCSKDEMLSGLKELTDLASISERVDEATHRVIEHLTREKDPEIRGLAAICLGRLLGGNKADPLEALLKEASRGGEAALEALLVLVLSQEAPEDALKKRVDELLAERVDAVLKKEISFQNNETACAGYKALSILPDDRCARRLLEQLQENGGRRYYNEYCYEALKMAVADHRAKLSNDLLRELISLENIAWLEEYPSGRPGVRPIDCREVRELAGEELRHRGETCSVDEVAFANRLEEMKQEIDMPHRAGTAAAKGNLELVKSLIPNGEAYRELRRHLDYTVLYHAAAHGRLEVVKYLLSIGADPNESCGSWDEPHTTPYRAAKDKPEIRNLLAAHGGRD